MAASGEIVFLQRFCRSPECATVVFYICRPCYRGQTYCSQPCRENSRRTQRREANRRHQQGDCGRLDHRDRQREYRRRKAFRVTDQGSAARRTSATVASDDTGLAGTDDRWPEGPRAAFSRVVCIRCGRSGELIDPFGG